MRDLVVGDERPRAVFAHVRAFVVGVVAGVLAHALWSAADARERRTGVVTTDDADERCGALPGERCECWVRPW